jgi:hypothetical protein
MHGGSHTKLFYQQSFKIGAVSVKNIEIDKAVDTIYMAAFVVLPKMPVPAYPGLVHFQIMRYP